MRSNKKIPAVITTALLFLPTFVFAAAKNPQDTAGDYNMALISLVGLVLILLFVIGALANVLRQLAFVVRDKNRKARTTVSNISKMLLLMAAFSTPAIHALAAAEEKVATPVSTTVSGIPSVDFYVIISVICLEMMVILALVIYLKQLLSVISGKPEAEQVTEKIAHRSWFWDKFNAAVPIEKEKDLLLDHNYDGIQELDNSLPPWWKYGFYLTIVVACIYLYRYHISNDGPSQHDEYVAEMQKGEEDKAAFLANSANNVDENSVSMLSDAGEIATGKEIFVKTCAPCHLADGGGTVGPNLTDEYWLHGGGIKDIFKSIKYGWQDKGMKSWKEDFSPKQIQQLASFVKSLKGTHPAVPKDAQGDLYIEAAPGTNAPDSTKTNNSTSGTAGKAK